MLDNIILETFNKINQILTQVLKIGCNKILKTDFVKYIFDLEITFI